MKRMLRSAVFAATLLATQYASATGIPVFDVANFGQNVITAAKAVSGEIYQNTNIMYQYQMMANQLLQATKLDPSAMKAQFDQISGDISKIKNLNSTLKNLYGSLTDDGQWLSQVQTLIARSGKSNDQWFSDMNTLYQQNDKVAKNLFNMGTSIMSHTDDLAKRRQDLQSQLSLSPTAQATAELTTHYLDIVTSQKRGSAATQCGESPTRCARAVAGPAGPEGEGGGRSEIHSATGRRAGGLRLRKIRGGDDGTMVPPPAGGTAPQRGADGRGPAELGRWRDDHHSGRHQHPGAHLRGVARRIGRRRGDGCAG